MEGETDDAFRTKQWAGEPWRDVKVSSHLGSLMLRSGNLRRSVRFVATGSTVDVSSSMVYAGIHNNGGTIRIPVSDKMRRFFWAQYKKSGDAKYKAMALSKKTEYTVQMPKRQFVGVQDSTNLKLQKKLYELAAKIDFVGAVKIEVK